MQASSRNIHWGGGGGAIYTKRDNCVHRLCHLLSLNCQRGGQNYGRVIGNVHTVLVERMSWICMLMRGHVVVCAGSVCSLLLRGIETWKKT